MLGAVRTRKKWPSQETAIPKGGKTVLFMYLLPRAIPGDGRIALAQIADYREQKIHLQTHSRTPKQQNNKSVIICHTHMTTLSCLRARRIGNAAR